MTKLQDYELTELNNFHYFRIDTITAEVLRTFLSQLLETWMDDNNSLMLVTLDKEEAYNLSRALRDLLVGYKHPRTSSAKYRHRYQDKTLNRLIQRFPKLLTPEER